MYDSKIKNLEDFYNYIDANVFKHTDTINIEIDTNLLNETDKNNIELINHCLKYLIKHNSTVPILNYSQGDSYPNIDNLTKEDVDCLYNCAINSKNPYIKAKISHFLFIKAKVNNKINFAQNAIDSYFELYKYYADANEMYLLADLYDNLADLVIRVNYKIDEFKTMSINIIKYSTVCTLVQNATDFLITQIKKKNFKSSILKGAIKNFHKRIKESDNIHLIEIYINLGRKISKINNGNVVQWDLLQAKYYGKEMKKAEKINNYFSSASWCKNAITYYKKIKNRTKINYLMKKYENLCKNTKYQKFELQPVDLKEEIIKLQKRIDKADTKTIISDLYYMFIPQYKTCKQTAEKNIKNSTIFLFCSTVYTDIYGHTVGYSDNDKENLKHELWNVYRIIFDVNSKLLYQYIFYAIKSGKLNALIFLEYLKTTWYYETFNKNLTEDYVLKYRWFEHIKEPIISYFHKQIEILNNKYQVTYINEVDSLTLKIEGILRNIVEIANLKEFPVRVLVSDNNGREISKWKSINDLLWDKNIFKILSEDDVWFMRFFLIDYIDLRNDVAHCLLLSPYQEQYYLSTQWLLIVLLRLSVIVTQQNT